MLTTYECSQTYGELGLYEWLDIWSLEPEEQSLSSSEECFVSWMISFLKFSYTWFFNGKALIGDSDPSSSILLASILKEC